MVSAQIRKEERPSEVPALVRANPIAPGSTFSAAEFSIIQQVNAGPDSVACHAGHRRCRLSRYLRSGAGAGDRGCFHILYKQALAVEPG